MNKALLRRMVLACAVGMPFAMLSGSAMGETNNVQATPAPAPAPAEPANTLAINGLVGIDFVTAYVTRGVVLENQGFIAQPYAELQFKLAEGGDFINKVSGVVGIWNSLHSEHTDEGLVSGVGDASELSDPWYEFDWYVGVSMDIATNWNLTWVYQEFISPNDGFNTNDNTQLKLSFNDASLWGDSGFALKPYGLVFVELDNKAGTGPDEGIYTEFGIEPAWALGDSGVTLSVPMKVGFGWEDFYEEDEEFGFASVGGKVSFPLKFMPAKYGAWSAYASVEYFFLGDGVDDFNDASVHTDDDIIVGKAGVSFTF
jgi:hypothetical protein